MTFNPLAAINVTEVSLNLKNKDSGVIDMGSQTLNFSPGIIDKILQRRFSIDKQTEENLKDFKNRLLNDTKITTKDFILNLGFKK